MFFIQITSSNGIIQVMSGEPKGKYAKQATKSGQIDIVSPFSKGEIKSVIEQRVRAKKAKTVGSRKSLYSM